MRKSHTIFAPAAVAALAVIGLTATSAQAVSPHYVSGPSVSVAGNSLTVSFKAAGLGNLGVTQADFTLTGTIEATAQ